MVKLGLNDKNGQELFADDTVQVVNGVNAGKTLYNIRASAKPYYILGNLTAKNEQGALHISCKKVMRLSK